MSFVWPTSHVGMLYPFGPAKAREQAEAFLQMADLAAKGVGYAKAKTKFAVSHQQVETRKSLYEELGLLYVPASSDQLVLTDAGRQLYETLGPKPTATPSDELRLKVDTLLCWAMTRCQINRPQSFGSPAIASADRAACTIRPYAAFWKAILELDGELTFEEFWKVLARVQRVEDYEHALNVIRAARDGDALPKAPTQSDNFRYYWNSHLSVAGSVLTLGRGDTFTITAGREKVLAEVLRAQAGCDLSDSLNVIRARPWKTVQDYYEFAGQACPEYLASGQLRVRTVGAESIVILRDYKLHTGQDGSYVEGGVELCALKLGTPCFHNHQATRILRLDRKIVSGVSRVRLVFGLGRPINDPSVLLAEWNSP